MSWRLARSLQVLRQQLDAAHPDRDRASDGTIAGTAHHQLNPNSDHEPNAAGVVRALDVDAGPGLYPQGADRALAVELAELVRALIIARHPALIGGGYVIWDGRIASEVDGGRWRPYSGTSAHREHVHVSVGRLPDAYDSEAPWQLPASEKAGVSDTPPVSARPAPAPAPREALIVRTVDLRAASAAHLVTGPGVRPLQALLELAGCLHGPVDGKAGPGTRSALIAYQTRVFGHADAIAGPSTFSALVSA